MHINWRKILWFLGLLVIYHGLLTIAFLWHGGTLTSLPGIAYLLAYMAGPLIATLIVQKGIYHEPLVSTLAISFRLNRWFYVAWLLPALLSLLALCVALFFPGVTFGVNISPAQARILTPAQLAFVQNTWLVLLISLVSGLLAGATVNALAGFGEEAGWRGLLLRELLPLGFWKAALLIGVIWGLWHTPVILMGYNFPEHRQLGILLMTISTTLLSPLFCYVTLRARSVIAAAVFHGTLNGTVGITALTRGASDLIIGLGVAYITVLLLANLALLWYMRRHPTDDTQHFPTAGQTPA